MAVEIKCVVDTQSELAEGPSWDAVRGVIWWVDIVGGVIHQYNPEINKAQSWQVGHSPSFIFARPVGDIVVGTRIGFCLFNPDSGTLSALSDPKPKNTEIRFNDAAMDSKGRIWAGSMKDIGERVPVGAYYCLHPDNNITFGPEGYMVTNATAFSPDESLIYTGETDRSVRKIFVHDYDITTGNITNKRDFFDTNGLSWRPDGACMDSEGNLWVAGIEGGVLVQLSPEGDILQQISLPVEKPTKPVFGGKDLDILYLTSLRQGLNEDFDQPHAGSLLEITGIGAKGIV